MKKLLIAGALLLAACGTVTIGVALAAVGIAALGTETYCASPGVSCPSGEAAWAQLVEPQAVADAAILSTSSTVTVAQLAQITANLQAALATGQQFGSGQAQAVAVVAAITVVLTLIEALHPAPGATVVVIPAMTTADKSALYDMQTKIGAAHAKLGSKPMSWLYGCTDCKVNKVERCATDSSLVPGRVTTICTDSTTAALTYTTVYSTNQTKPDSYDLRPIPVEWR